MELSGIETAVAATLIGAVCIGFVKRVISNADKKIVSIEKAAEENKAELKKEISGIKEAHKKDLKDLEDFLLSKFTANSAKHFSDERLCHGRLKALEERTKNM